MYRNKIYLAGPFFSDRQIEHVRQVEALLKENPTVQTENIFVPMDQDASVEFEVGSLEWQRIVFNSDIRQIHQSDCVVAILDYVEDKEGNKQPDSGTIFELGVAFQANIPVVLVQFDETNTLNLMLAQSYTHFFNGQTEIQKLATYDFNQLIPNVVPVSVI